MYNLSNPALNNDLGLANLDRMMPNPVTSFGIGFIPGVTGTMSDVKMQGSLKDDKFQMTRKEKDSNNIKKGLAFAGIITAGVLCFKGGKKILKGIGNIFKKIKAKFKK